MDTQKQSTAPPRHLLLFGLIGLLPLAMTQLSLLLLPSLPELMQPIVLHQAMWLIVGLMLSLLRQRATQLAGMVLIILSAMGQAHAMAAYIQYGAHFRTDLQIANLIYLGMSFLHIAGMLLYERLRGIDHRLTPPPKLNKELPGSLFVIILVAFPFAWAIDLVISVGHIPLFSGGAFVQDIYSLDYGRLYGYGILIAMAALFLRERLRETQSTALSLVIIGTLLLYCFISVIDGKRVFLMIFLIALALSELRFRDWNAIRARFGGIAIGLVVLYVGIEVWRQGGSTTHRDAVVFTLMATGVEYRDFAFVIQNLKYNALANYDLLKSAIGGFGNWFILALFGVHKGEYVYSGSAYQIAITMRSGFGIRIGLLAELFVGYQWWGGLVGMALGALYAAVASALMRVKSEVAAVFLCMVLGVFLLGYVGQVPATTGYLSLLLYLWLLWRLLTALGRYYGGVRRPVPAYRPRRSPWRSVLASFRAR